MDISEDYVGTPLEIKRGLLNQNQKLKQQIEELSAKTAEMISSSADKLCGIYNLAKKRHQFSEVRRNAIRRRYVLLYSRWMDEKSAKSLEKEINGSDDVVMFYIGGRRGRQGYSAAYKAEK